MGKQFARVQHLAAAHGDHRIRAVQLQFSGEPSEIGFAAVVAELGCGNVQTGGLQIGPAALTQTSGGGTAAKQQGTLGQGRDGP